MRDVTPTERFKRLYEKLPEQVKKRVKRTITRLRENPNYPSLQVKKMVNQVDIYEARVDIHYRITFDMTADQIILRAVGTHEIYRKP